MNPTSNPLPASRHVPLFAVAALFLWVSVVPVAAQSASTDPPRMTLGAALGVATPWHGDRDYLAGGWLGTVDFGVSPRLAFEVGAGGWHHGDTTVTEDVTLHGPEGVLGHIDRLTRRTTERVTGVGASWVVRAGRRVVFRAGGGPGLYVYRRVVERTTEGCVAENPASCAAATTTFTSARAGVQGLADVAFNGKGNVQPFVQVRVAVADVRDVASGHLSALGGVRVALW